MDIRQPISTNGGDWLGKFGEAWQKQVSELKRKFGEKIEDVKMPGVYPTDVPIVYVDKSALLDVLRFVKEAPGFDFNFLADLTATDEECVQRFEVIYNLFSHSHRARLRLKVRVKEGEEVPSSVLIWKGANWAEREVFDMFGIRFSGHPDLRRILMDSRWVGHPLRKDYPLKGYQLFTRPEPVDPTLLK